MITEEQRSRARGRIAAKDFAATIPTNMAIRVPDAVIDALNDLALTAFIQWLEANKYKNVNGKWERV